MFGMVIKYDYSGDEADWQTAVDTFISDINEDARLKGGFSYQVNVAGDGKGRVHIGQWDAEETLNYLQSQPFFGEFGGKVKDFAGGAPDATRFKLAARTAAPVAG